MKSKVAPGIYYKMMSLGRYCALKGLEPMPPVGGVAVIAIKVIVLIL